MRNIGEQAPDFNCLDQQGEERSLRSMLERGPVVVYFYPADFTPVCTAEACAFRDQFEALDAASVQIVGISPQSASSHQRFADRYGLPFPLLSDERKKIIRSYGVDGPLGFGVRRATFYILPDGSIANRVVADFFVGNHMDLIKQILKQHERNSQ